MVLRKSNNAINHLCWSCFNVIVKKIPLVDTILILIIYSGSYKVDGSAHGLSIKLRTSLKRISDNLIQHVSTINTKQD